MDNVFDFEPVLSYDKVKSELILGQSDTDFRTKYNIEYYDKSCIIPII